MDNPKVSVVCLLYNMKDYIADALDGMLMQETDFPFEILVHDDASTDGSTEILREYAEKHPDKIVPVYQTENQGSKGIAVSNAFLIPKARGEYIAYCEGDDYWTDPKKLQKQYDFMSTHPDYTICTAKVRQVNCKDPSIPDKLIGDFETGEVTIEQILALRDKQAFCTCSIFLRADVLRARPDTFRSRGERMMILWMALNGKLWFLNEEVGVYRRERPGSWSSRSWNSGNEKKIKTYFGYIKAYKHFGDFSENRFYEHIQNIVLRYMQMALRAGCKLKVFTKGEMKDYYNFLTPDRKKKLTIYKLLLPARKAAHWVKTKIKK